MDQHKRLPAEKSVAPVLTDVGLTRMERLAPRPTKLADTGLSEAFLADLIAKHLLDGGVLRMSDLVERVKLAGPIIESVLNFMRKEARIEVRGTHGNGSGNSASGNLRYALTERGRTSAQDAMYRSGYVGPAPMPLEKYVEVAKAQTVHGHRIDRAAMADAFSGIIIRPDLVDKLGPAMNSGRAVFIYGPAGTGKTFITQHLVRLFPDTTLIPYSIVINEVIVEVFDPLKHRLAATDLPNPNVMLERGHDPRFALCRRPIVIAGGELTADMLDIHYDAATHRFQAPLQLKANNGIFIIDDMGRQRVAPETVFNRWIVPLEEKIDYLNLGSGQHFSVPFDTILVFSTNLHPLDLADEAFLRRIGYKIEFPYLLESEYEQIWKQFCAEHEIVCEPDVFDFAINELHGKNRKPLLPCHPRDLLSIAAERATYEGHGRLVNTESLSWAWTNYFVSMKPGT
jgi:hypothetical protein